MGLPKFPQQPDCFLGEHVNFLLGPDGHIVQCAVFLASARQRAVVTFGRTNVGNDGGTCAWDLMYEWAFKHSAGGRGGGLAFLTILHAIGNFEPRYVPVNFTTRGSAVANTKHFNSAHKDRRYDCGSKTQICGPWGFCFDPHLYGGSCKYTKLPIPEMKYQI